MRHHSPRFQSGRPFHNQQAHNVALHHQDAGVFAHLPVHGSPEERRMDAPLGFHVGRAQLRRFFQWRFRRMHHARARRHLERLTTTKVAMRAGVSVGTLYQYFPNKGALLKAALKHHLDEVTEAIELVCHAQQGNSLEQMATALMTEFLQAKLRDVKASVALYSVSSDIDGTKIVQEMGIRSNQAVVAMLKTAKEQLFTDPQLVASMLQGVMFGV